MKPIQKTCCSAVTAMAALAYAIVTLAAAPNILVIVADDLGYADVGFNGCQDISTPHLDALAQRSTICASGYVTHPFCSPTRAALLTGRYQARFGYETNPEWAPNDKAVGLPAEEVLLPSVLKEAGYATACIGKWHLGGHPDLHPIRRGFDEFFGILHGGHTYLPAKSYRGLYDLPLNRNGRAEPLQEHLTDVLAREAAAFIAKQGSQPWFLYLAFNAPHGPLESTPELIQRASHIGDDKRRHYAALLIGLDDAIGVVLDELESSGQTNDTLVFFFSDNGGTPKSNSDNSPLRGAKGGLFEGGIRVPFLVSWPGRLPEGTKYDAAVSTLDVFPTAIVASDAKVLESSVLDGVNLLPYLTGETVGPPHDCLFWRQNGGSKFAVRHSNWKLVKHNAEPPQLYDLSNDIGETKDLASSKPQLVEQLIDAYKDWNKNNG